MPLATKQEPIIDPVIAQGLQQLAELPDWLAAAARPAAVAAALERHVAELRAGSLRLRRCKVDRVRLQAGRWEARYELVVEGADGQPRELAVGGALAGPSAEPAAGAGALGDPGWRCFLPELGLDLRADTAAEEEFQALPLLTDPEQARAFLERSMRAGAPAYRDIAISACAPKVMRNKPGRCTVRYQLEYAGDGAGRLPNPVIAKTYSREKGRDTYASMRKLWDSPLSRGDVVAIAEPLAYDAANRVLVQGPVRGDRDLKDLLRAALRAGTPAALAELDDVVRKTAAGLAALHQSGARHGPTITWDDELAEIRGEVAQLSAGFPWVAGAIEPLLGRLAARAAAHPADAALPAHRSFRPQQVLIDRDRIGFIDFDGFCLAEPALDIALFRATAKEFGINTSPSEKQKEFEYPSEQDRLARMAQLDVLCELFLAEYARVAPVSRERVALWEALDLLTVVLRCWSKVKPHQLSNAILALESQLGASGLLSAP